jgi:hypothetical protein
MIGIVIGWVIGYYWHDIMDVTYEAAGTMGRWLAGVLSIAGAAFLLWAAVHYLV